MNSALADLEFGVDKLASVIELVALAVLLIGVLLATAGFLRELVRRGAPVASDFMAIRTVLGGHVLLALEILICADIMHTVARRTLDDLITLAAVVAIRTVIAYFLDRELRQARELAGRPATGGS